MKTLVMQEKNQWDEWLLQQEASFLQSWEWGECLKATGQTVERLAVVENGETIAQAQVVYKQTVFGWRYALCPKGPVVDQKKLETGNWKLGDVLTNHLQQKRCIFFRVEPSFAPQFLVSSFQFQAVRDINPPATLVLDITKTEDELLAATHEKTRYNIRLAQKKGLTVREGKNFEAFWYLMQKTGERDKFALHSKESYAAVLASPAVRQLLVYHGDEAIATACFIGFGKILYYLYGASDHTYRQFMAPHLAQWEGIKLAKKLGYTQYDFFGISPRKHDTRYMENDTRQYFYDTQHRYAGVTRFKLGFGGEIREEPGTFDLIISPGKYKMYQLLRRIRRFF